MQQENGQPKNSSFNPRLRTGGDPACIRTDIRSTCFNPRLRTGGDHRDGVACHRDDRFQSTPPHGRRPMFLRP